jgi:protein transport protein SEC24
MTVDDRWFTMAAVLTMDIPSSVVYFYPRLISIHDMEDDNPNPVRCSIEKMQDNGVYILGKN